LVDPAKRQVTVQRPDENRVVSAAVTDVLSLPDVVPGWELPLSEIFET
jgi:Uma2 family endonuclease